jgi:hypothetical protein
VLPVVFTAAGVVESDITQAGEHGIGLIGANELEQLLLLIKTPDVTVEQVLQHLRPHQTIADLILGTAGQLAQ